MSPDTIPQRIRAGVRRRSNWWQMVRFGVVGASGYVVNIAVFAVLVEGAEVHHVPAAIGAFCVAVTNNFLWNRYWTFAASEGHAGFQAARFLSVSLAALGINLVALELLIEAGMAAVPAQALAVAIAMPFNFIGNKLWTFA